MYAGFDPSANSLQVGNLVTIIALMHFQRCGHRVIAVVGGATGMIGDPSGKTSERPLLDEAEIRRNVAGIRENLSRFVDFRHPTAPAKILNNYDWLGEFRFIDFLRDVGRHFRLNAMLAKESVRTRLQSEAGMSFTEFSYQLLQAYDFLHLYDTEGCILQIGGSDQWGNITAGIELIRKLRGGQAYGLTIPLLCDSTGQKFGKSEGNAIYLSSERTSCYDFYQFFIRTADADVVKLLRVFTLLPVEEIEQLAERVKVAPEQREAQRRLAEEVTRMVHGEDGLRVAQRASAVLFGEPMDDLRPEELLSVFSDAPSTELRREELAEMSVADLAVRTGLCASKGAVRRLAEGGGLYLNNRRVSAVDGRISEADLIGGRLLVLRSGKKNHHLVRIL
ncbi:MAG: tyrosine--tRNA ligase [Kiritimatiellae bacterium]|nr:tyrosine--tRNA ligase [Kiritimatiellia bacterium]